MGSHAKNTHGIQPTDEYYGTRGYSRVPGLVQWMTTMRCPLSCPHCLASAGEHAAPGELGLGQARTLIDEVAEMGVDELLLTGGEPLVRPDLPLVIQHLARREVSYSLNTVCMPEGETRRALETYPPRFVAVSLDGPKATHDGFRGRDGSFDEAIEAMAFFADLGCDVAAGTTVTRRNFSALTETLAIVSRSAATTWGIHLLFPQGRARNRPDLFLTRRQMKRLLRFVADKRAYYPVELADEFGHCGELEPLVRDLPLSCGAGRTQCVVLPNGDVVPCTTTDLAESAGNVTEQPLAEIWERGFAARRARASAARCTGCDHFAACGGGCWLQEGGDNRCYRDLWDKKHGSAAAGVLVALGLSSAAACGSASQPTHPSSAPEESIPATTAPEEAPEEPIVAGEVAAPDPTPSQLDLPDPFPYQPLRTRNCTTVASAIEREILAEFAPGRGGGRIQPTEGRSADPAWRFLTDYAAGSLPADITARSQRAREALETRERSLSVSALLFRALAEPILDMPAGRALSTTEQRAVEETLHLLGRTTEQWRRDIFEGRLDPHLRPAASRPRCMRTKAGPQAWERLAGDTNEERWAELPPAEAGTAPPSGAAAPVPEQWFARHRHGEGLELHLSMATAGWRVIGPAGERPVTRDTPMGIFDVLAASQGQASGDDTVTARWSGDRQLEVAVRVPSGGRLTYPDLLRMAHQQATQTGQGLPTARAVRRDAAPNPLLLMAMRNRRHSWWLADFWLF